MTSKSVAIFGGGCFWCIEAIIQRFQGVEKVESGYAGGQIATPTYREVCSGRTGHAEVVKVTFDPEVLSYEDLLWIFMVSHDPTTLNRQGGDSGTQYRSMIMYLNEEQKSIAQQILENLKTKIEKPIVTELAAYTGFYPAEDYHQNYYNNNPDAAYCQVIIDPKIRKIWDQFAKHLKVEKV